MVFITFANTKAVAMKSFSMLSLTFSAALLAASCGGNNSGAGYGHSAPIDSTNKNGTAPVQYSAQDPQNPTDTSMQRKTHDLSVQDQQATQKPTDTTVNSSNTTDARATSGSAQGSKTAPGSKK